MNRLEIQTTKAAEELASKHGRCAFVLVMEPDGINAHGLNYTVHCAAHPKATDTVKILMNELNKHYINILHYFLDNRKEQK
jgi:hypothetical protein